MDKNTQQPVAWINHKTLGERVVAKLGSYYLSPTKNDEDDTPLYTAPPMPRDVLMELAEAVESELVTGGYVVLTESQLSAIVDRYASRLQPEPVCQTCKGRGVIGGHVGQTPESFDYVTEDCPDCQHPASAQPVAVPDGYVLVPKEPTAAMVEAGFGCDDDNTRYWRHPKDAWRCMVAAAQKPEGV